MPVLVLPAAAGLVLAAVALLILLAWPLLGRTVARIVPDWHIPLLGNLQSAALALVVTAGKAMAHRAEQAVSPIAKVMLYPVHAVGLLFGATVGAVRAIHATETWVVHSLIPHYYRAALHRITANNAAIYRRISHVHVAVDAYVHYAILHDAALAKADAARALATAWTRMDAISHRIARVHRQVDAYVHYAITHDAALARHNLALVRAWADQRMDTLSQRITANRAAANAYIHYVYTHAIAHADAAAAAAKTAAVAQLDTNTVTHLAPTWDDVRAGVDGLSDTLAGDFADVARDLAAIPRALPQTVPVSIASVAALAVPLLRLAEDCTVPNCRNLSSFGRDLAAMTEAIEVGSMFPWLIELITDPESGAAGVISDLQEPMDTIVADIRTMAGV